MWFRILSIFPTQAHLTVHLKMENISLRTTHLSQMIDILSSVPLTPSGIKLKSSLPTARCAVLKGQCALPVTCRSPLCTRSRKEGTKFYYSWYRNFWLYVQFKWLDHLAPGQQGVEIIWCGWVGAQWWGGDVGGCFGPVLAPIVRAVCPQACSDWLSVDHSAYKEK